MSTKEVEVRYDQQDLQKQLGCMNGIFQLFDRRYLLGQRRHKRLPPGQSDNGERLFSSEPEQAKEKDMKEKHRVSVELSRNSFSSCTSSAALSSLECSKREQSSSCPSAVSQPSPSPSLQRKQPDFSIQSPDIRDVVKDSMTREPRVVSIITAAKDVRSGPAMKHIDSPRPFPLQKLDQYDGNDRKLREIPWAVKEVKATSRFSCDGRESRYLLKSNMKIKELPRLSLDSKQSSIRNSANDPRRSLLLQATSQIHEPTSNKRPSSSVVARLMGLEDLTASVDESEELVTNSRSSREEEEIKHGRISVSPRVHKDLVSSRKGISNVITRIPLETAPWKQEGSARGSKKPPFKNKEAPAKAETASHSIYGEIEKRLTEHEFKTAGKDLRALKQILEAMQKTRKRLENKDHALDNSSIDHKQSQKIDQPVSPTIKGIRPHKKHEFLKVNIKPTKLPSDAMMITDLQKVKHTDARKDSVGRQRLKDPTLRDRKATGRPPLTSNFPEYVPREKSTSSRYTGIVSPRMHRSKNGTDKPSIHGPSSAWGRTKQQPSMHPTPVGSTTRDPEAKSMDPLHTEQLHGYKSETRNLSQQSDTVSFQSESNSLNSQNDSEVTSTEWIQEVNSSFRPKENHRSNIMEQLIEDRPMADHAKHTMEQPSPVSVLDAFYTEDAPSPVKKKSHDFNDYKNLHFEEAQDQARIDDLANSTYIDQYSGFNKIKLENIKSLVQKIELLNTNAEAATVNHTATSPRKNGTGDHGYVKEILFASGFFKDLDCTTTMVKVPPAGNLINPELFHVLEKTKERTEDDCHKENIQSKSNERIRRRLVFDTVNDVLGHKLAMLGPSQPWNNKHKGRILNGNKLLKELCSGIDSLQNNSERGIYDEDDEVLNIINADVNKRSQDWDEHCYEVPGLVLDIERLIFKDLINEVVNAQVTSLQDWPERHRRQLFSM